MKAAFSSSWLASKRPNKQRKFRFNAPLHIKHTFLNAHLSKPLRTQYGKRSLPLRKGDEVLVMHGSFAKKQAKVTSLILSSSTVYLEGIQRSKKDGSKYNVPFNPRALMLVKLVDTDKRRLTSPKTSQPTQAKQ
jgi:large subunit ribosomal protein L24